MFYKKKFSNAMKVLVTETFKEKFSYSKLSVVECLLNTLPTMGS